MTLTDTHCHIHEADYPLKITEVLKRADDANVKRMICVGTDRQSSLAALKLAAKHKNLFAAIGVHPHETKSGFGTIETIDKLIEAQLSTTSDTLGLQTSSLAASPSGSEGSLLAETGLQPRLVAVGEIGLDYFYKHSPRQVQIKAFEAQLQMALNHDLPVIFHVREAFDDFWPILDNFSGLKGVLHSFTDSLANLKQALNRGLYIGVNGIATFAPDKTEIYRAIPLENLLLETDSPFLTPVPHRGKVNEPAFTMFVAQFMADLRQTPLQELSAATEQNATTLFKIPKAQK